MQKVLIVLIRLYQLTISPYLGNNCRFTPTCSSYATQSIKRFGAMSGGWLSVKRICRCHPFHSGGEDPVPQTPSSKG